MDLLYLEGLSLHGGPGLSLQPSLPSGWHPPTHRFRPSSSEIGSGIVPESTILFDTRRLVSSKFIWAAKSISLRQKFTPATEPDVEFKSTSHTKRASSRSTRLARQQCSQAESQAESHAFRAAFRPTPLRLVEANDGGNRTTTD